MPFTTGAMIYEDGTLITPPPSQPQVAPATLPPAVDNSDVVGRYLNNVAVATPPPPVSTTTTPEQIAAAEAAGLQVAAGMAVLLAGGGSEAIAAAEAAAGASPETVQGILDANIPDITGLVVTSTNLPTIATDAGIDPIPETQNYGHDDQGEYDLLGEFPDLTGYELLSVNTLRGQAFLDYVRQGCAKRNLDALAVLANAYHEGLGGGIGDNGTSYGPWQLHDGGALPRKYWNLGKNVLRIQLWAWSPAGVDYALDAMATTSARGKIGRDAVYALVYEFERPADKPGQYLIRLRTYEQLAGMGGGVWQWLIPFAVGPKAVSATTPTPAPVKPQPTRVIGTWRDLITTLRDDVPAAGVHMQNTSRRLTKAVT